MTHPVAALTRGRRRTGRVVLVPDGRWLRVAVVLAGLTAVAAYVLPGLLAPGRWPGWPAPGTRPGPGGWWRRR